jgi:hypothetical protein
MSTVFADFSRGKVFLKRLRGRGYPQGKEHVHRKVILQES